MILGEHDLVLALVLSRDGKDRFSDLPGVAAIGA